MTGRQHKRRSLAQNFLKDKRLVRSLVARSSVGKGDTVYEIGAGRGIITAELGRIAARVVGIEKDPGLARGLRRRFAASENITIIEKDFLDLAIPPAPYKIFASIPYNLTATIVRRVLYERPFAGEACLIMQREPARKFSGACGETLFSLCAKPYVTFRVLAKLSRTDFEPAPKVDSVLLSITRRDRPLLGPSEIHGYREFVGNAFHGWKPGLKSALKDVFTYQQWKRIAKEVRFPLDATPTDLTFEQWLSLYEAAKKWGALRVRNE